MLASQEGFSFKPIYICPAGINVNQTFTVNKGKYLVLISQAINMQTLKNMWKLCNSFYKFFDDPHLYFPPKHAFIQS